VSRKGVAAPKERVQALRPYDVIKRKELLMKNIQYTSSPGVPHGSMTEEFLCHRNGSEWWYCTGYLNDKADHMFSFQFTLARVRIFGFQFNILMTALTDFATGKHYYSQKPVFFGKDVIITPGKVGLDGLAIMTFADNHLSLGMHGTDYVLSLNMEPAKQPAWHAEDGVLKMGLDDPKERTYYWSYTNLVTSGQLTLEGKTYALNGKSWFDKQGGTYTLTKRWTNWEWFSLRFFDNEEVMLFSFPQDEYQDGTYILKSGQYRRLNDYRISPTGFTQAGGNKFSNGWKVDLGKVKGGQYTIVPKIDGQMNLFYFELLADIRDNQGKNVGYCFVELLPGVYNQINPLKAFSRVKPSR
jgi:predicted secreted hydrolase